MKISKVEAIILESPKDYGVHGGESAGPRFRSLLRVSTDAGIDGWAEIETQPHVLKAVIDAPGDGSGMFEGLGRLVVGKDPFQIERFWDELYTGTIYYGRRGVVLQAISGIDLACFDIMGKVLQKPVHALLGDARRDRVTAYASTLFRETPQAMREAARKYISRGFRAVKPGAGSAGTASGISSASGPPAGSSGRTASSSSTSAGPSPARSQRRSTFAWRRRRSTPSGSRSPAIPMSTPPTGPSPRHVRSGSPPASRRRPHGALISSSGRARSTSRKRIFRAAEELAWRRR
jgi:hypothetical protein